MCTSLLLCLFRFCVFHVLFSGVKLKSAKPISSSSRSRKHDLQKSSARDITTTLDDNNEMEDVSAIAVGTDHTGMMGIFYYACKTISPG